MHSHRPHVMFAGGGDLRRLDPGLSIAEALRQARPEVEITFAGSGDSTERRLVRSAGYPYVVAPSQPPPHSTLEAVRFVTDNVAGFLAARWILREHQVSLVVGLGGAPAATVVRAAHSRGVPFVLVERDVLPTRTARKLGDSAEAVCLAFDATRPHLPIGARPVLTGAPGRPTFHRLHHVARERLERAEAGGMGPLGNPATPWIDEQRITVLGSPLLNETAPQALARMGARIAGWRIVHQAGEGAVVATEENYRAAGVEALVLSNVDEAACVIDESDVVICGADGATLAEVALAATPAVVVPLFVPGSSERENARLFASADGVRLVEAEGDRLPDAISLALGPLVEDAGLRRRYARSVLAFAKPEAARSIAAVCLQSLGRGRTISLAA